MIFKQYTAGVLHNPKCAVIWLHGLGADGQDFIPVVKTLNLPSTCAVKFIFPEAPIRPVSLNGGIPMRAWFDLYRLTQDAKVDITGIQAASEALKRCIQTQIDQGVAAERIILVGFSQGGALALYTGLTYAQRLGGIVGLSTFLPMMPECVQPKQVPIFMGYGRWDNVVSQALSEQACDALKLKGYQVDAHLYAMAHTVCAEEIKELGRWLGAISLSLG